MSNVEHLEWVYGRMKNVHGENENLDYMIRFKSIIDDLKSKEVRVTSQKTDCSQLDT